MLIYFKELLNLSYMGQLFRFNKLLDTINLNYSILKNIGYDERLMYKESIPIVEEEFNIKLSLRHVSPSES